MQAIIAELSLNEWDQGKIAQLEQNAKEVAN